MNRSQSFLFTVLSFVLIVSMPTESTAKPNIILIFIDDMGWEDFSCFGNKDAKTPNIDRMATEGIAFEQFYVNSPICSPSRVAISTGQYPLRWGITSYLNNRNSNKKRGMKNWLNPKAPMLARTLKKVGYNTGHFGKWHMGGQRNVSNAPPITKYGFDESLTNFEGMGAKLLPLTQQPDPNNPGKILDGRIWEKSVVLGEPVTWMQRSKITGGFVDAALKFIDKSVDQKKSFYINVWPDDVHGPYYPPVEKWGPTQRGLYLAVLEEMDRQFEKLFKIVRENPELRDNTLILICSDNGPAKDAGRAGVFKGYKTHLFEGGIRSPLVVWGPGIIDKNAVGTRNKTSIFSAVDLVPSLLKLAGGEIPSGVELDGEELLNTLIGKTKTSRQAPLFFCRPPDRKSFYGLENLPDLAVREGKWKLLCDYDGSRPMLFDLNVDPSESKNLADENSETVKRLSDQVTQWYRRNSDSE